METYELLLCALLLFLSGFLSGSEVALFTLSKAQLKSIRERFRSTHKIIRQMLSDPPGLLLSILISNELVNITLSTLITTHFSGPLEDGLFLSLQTFLSDRLPDWAADMALGTLVTAPLVLILGEVTPKVISARLNSIAAPIVARPMNFIYQMLSPIRWVVQVMTQLLTRLVPRRALTSRAYITQKLKHEDFLNMVEEAHKEGEVQQTELELLRGVFDLDETAVSEIVTPMKEVFVLPQTLSIEKAIVAIRDDWHKRKFSRIPVYGEDSREIVGILYSKDLLIAKLERADLQIPISTLVWKSLNVHHASKLSSVFKRMKRQRTHMAIVLDDSGDPMGIVTMNDVLDTMLEELVEADEPKFGGER